MRECVKCGESVPDTKAFCPACGAAMDDEAAASPSAGNMDGTMQFGQTLYNQMISEMGLDLSTGPAAEKKPLEKTADPVSRIDASPRPSAEQIVLKPAARPSKPGAGSPTVTSGQPPTPVADSGTVGINWVKWLLIAGVLLLLVGIFIVLVAAAVIYIYLPVT